MKTLYINCAMGAAGDMLMAALLELHPDPQAFIEKMNSLGIPGVKAEMKPAVKCGITGTHVAITVHGEEELSHDVNGHDHAHHHDHDHGHHHDHDHGENCSCGCHDHDHHHDHDHDHHHDHDHDHHHDHDHDHHHDHDHDHHHDHDHGHHHDHDHGHHHDHDHDHGHHHDHDHGHHHDHDHGHHHDHDHGHHHDHDHGHSHGAHGHHHHNGMHSISAIIEQLPVSDKVKADVVDVYKLIAEAEGHVHGKPIDEIHFHEVGTMDAIADITGVCMLMEAIGAEQIIVSPIHVGSGMVRCAHGVLPVPAPATAHILRGVPIYNGQIRGELCTPTGAALLKHFATTFGEMPIMKISQYGYGMGNKDFEAANCVRVCVGETEGAPDEVSELSCNLDDMTGEDIAFVQELLMDRGALDVYTINIGMKKGRPAIMLTCMCRKNRAAEMADLMLRHTTTLGVRETVSRRYVLDRKQEVIHTPLGDIQVKKSFNADVSKQKLEYADLARIAREHDMTLNEVRHIAHHAHHEH